MVETFQKKLSDSPAWRWTALVLLASAMFFAYIFVDILSPLQEFLQTQHGWDPIAYGRFAGSEPFLNVFVFSSFLQVSSSTRWEYALQQSFLEQ